MQSQLNLPSAPTYVQPTLGLTDNNLLSQYGTQLSSGDFSGDLSWLTPLVNQSNTQNALSAAQGVLQPQFRDTLQQINNDAAANNQLDSSTYTDALARSQSDLNSQYQSIVSQQAIQDAQNANANRLSLFGTGLNTLQQATSNDAAFTGAQNSFNQQNYENELGATLAQYNPSGGLGGALTGAIGGGLAGLATGNPLIAAGGAVAGGLTGGLTSQSSNTGSSLLQAGAGIYGQSQGINRLTGLLSYIPGSSATNNINSTSLNTSGALGPEGNSIDYLKSLLSQN